jgi:hypothetical protein
MAALDDDPSSDHTHAATQTPTLEHNPKPSTWQQRQQLDVLLLWTHIILYKI